MNIHKTITLRESQLAFIADGLDFAASQSGIDANKVSYRELANKIREQIAPPPLKRYVIHFTPRSDALAAKDHPISAYSEETVQAVAKQTAGLFFNYWIEEVES